ncbi:MAG: (5-formylfuran-3-yl)methyl phosphate synthase [Gammaproteobacteria bacterium]
MNTGLLASVCTMEEARLVFEAGADIIDLKDPEQGALGALPADRVRRITATIHGRATVSATIGDLPFTADRIGPAILNMAAAGVDLVKVGVFGDLTDDRVLQELSTLTGEGIRIVLVLFAEDYRDDIDFSPLGQAAVSGVMLDTRDKQTGPLRMKLADNDLIRFVRKAGETGLMTGLAGSLSISDVPPLLRTNPDYLGFRGALCRKGRRTNRIDGEAVRRMRSLLPQKNENPLAAAITI